MSAADNGGPAFPHFTKCGELAVSEGGMTLRDYFAAKAMNGICASGPGSHMTNSMIANEAYSLADAMLEARK